MPAGSISKSVILSPDDNRRLDWLAGQLGCNKSDAIRLAVRHMEAHVAKRRADRASDRKLLERYGSGAGVKT